MSFCQSLICKYGLSINNLNHIYYAKCYTVVYHKLVTHVCRALSKPFAAYSVTVIFRVTVTTATPSLSKGTQGGEAICSISCYWVETGSILDAGALKSE